MSQARTKSIGAVVALAAALASGCGCAEIWSVAEELGAGLLAGDAPAPPPLDRQLGGGVGDSAAIAGAQRSAEPDPRAVADGARVSRHLAELCLRMRRGNSSFVKRHVELPMSARMRIEEGAGPGAFRDVVFEDPYELRMSGICADLTWLGTSVDVQETDGGWIVRASGTGSRVELEFRRTAKGRPKLIRYWQL